MSTEQNRGATAPRTLADDLRARDDASLAELLRARPDLLSPVPNDLTQLATRAGTRASVVRAVERLDRFALQTAEAIAVATDPCTYGALSALLTGDPEYIDDPASQVAAELPRALCTLRAQALLWGGDDKLRLVRTARELLTPGPSAPSPTGLGPTLAEATSGMSPGRLQDILANAGLPGTHDPVSALTSLTSLFTDRSRMADLLDRAPPESLAMLDKLRWGPPYGSVQAEAPSVPVTWLLGRALLVRSSSRTVVLPREVALHLRAGRAHRHIEPLAPQLTAQREYPPETVDAAAAGQALSALGTLEDLLADWELDPPSVLRAGGLGVRDLKRTATALDVPEPTAAFWVELAYATGLLAPDGGAEERYAPTPGYDEWLRKPAHERWAHVVVRWLTGTRVPGLVGDRDSKGRALAALGQGLDRGLTADVRRRTLASLTELPPGAAPSQQSVLGRLSWEQPLRASGTGGNSGEAPGSSVSPSGRAASGMRTQLAEWALHEAELLGLTGRGALASYARELIVSGDGPRTAPELEALAATASRAAEQLAPLLPEPLDHILLQADLTAVAPGPLERPLAAMLGVLADVESKGGATVYRFTPASVLRALDAGRSAADLHAFLAAHSRTPVPQPLSYLVDDVARRHGTLRGRRGVLVRTLRRRRAAQRDPRGQAIGGAAPAPPRTHGARRAAAPGPTPRQAPGDGIRAGRRVRRRRRADRPRRRPPHPAAHRPRAGARRPSGPGRGAAHRGGTGHPGRRSRGDREAPAAADIRTAVALAGPGRRPAAHQLRRDPRHDAGRRSSPATALWIGYVNAEGAASQRVIAPVRVEGGFVTAYDHTADEVRTYPLHRITGVAELADS